ncbi:MAG: DNA-directed RNA polymerase subunit B'' [Candidatus Pacearchaeota archaeon]
MEAKNIAKKIVEKTDAGEAAEADAKKAEAQVKLAQKTQDFEDFDLEKGKILVESYLREYSLTQSNIDSYNDFFERRLQLIINTLNEQLKEEKAAIELGKIWLGKPEFVEIDGSKKAIMPIECRIRKLTYCAPLFLEIGYVGKEKQVIEIAKIPVMVKSKFCNLYGLGNDELIAAGEDPTDPGGYFIINGNERAIMMMEDLASNNIFVEETDKGLSLRLFSQKDSYRIPLQLYLDKDGILKINFSRFKDIPAIILIKALGLTKDSEIAQKIGIENDEVIVNIYEFAEINSVEAAWQWLAEKFELSGTAKEIRDAIRTRLDNGLLPHLGVKPADRESKADLLCKLIKQFLIYLHEKVMTDKDHCANKRIRLSGDLLYDLFRAHLALFIKDIQQNIEKYARRKEVADLRIIAKSILLSNRIESSIATGNWVGEKKGVTQNIDKTNYLSKLSQLLRVVSLLSAEQENFPARTLHPTQWGRFCPIETPEGTNIGLRKNLSFMARVTTEVVLDENKFIKQLNEIGLSDSLSDTNEYDVLHNGKFIGKANLDFVKHFKEKRRRGEIDKFISISYDSYAKIIHIWSDAGRIVRPLIVVENGSCLLKPEHIEKIKKNQLKFSDLVKQGIIEWIDASEEDNCLVALNSSSLSEADYLEIDPIATLGIVTALVPYANHNQSSRLNRGSKTQKQALGLFAANFPLLCDTDVHLLHYPQKPLVRSICYDAIGFWPAGQNMIVAVTPYYGYNIEDAVILNKGSVDRALARSHYFRPYSTVEMRYTGNLKDKICIPEKDVKGYKAEKLYAHLEDDGIAYLEEEVNEGEVVIGKVSPPKFLIELEELTAGQVKKENSVTVKEEESGIVDAVFISLDADGNKIVQVRTREERIPELGDKFSSYHGQKGVVGFIFDEVDMPFTARGIRPDLIFNPHSIPSRMSVGYLLELLAGKIASNAGKILDATPFRTKEEELEKALLELGFRPDGKELMFDPITGKHFEAKIFIGNLYYLKLKYLVTNKLHTRGFGKVALLTRQPVEGRAKGGGLRLGEMEKDCLIAHGASLLLKERFGSDDVVVYVCQNCGTIGYRDHLKNKLVCPLCNSNRLDPVEIAYASKLLFEELQSMHIGTTLKLKNKFEE